MNLKKIIEIMGKEKIPGNEPVKFKEDTIGRKILFVCNGNRFRSFSAEVLLRHYLDSKKIKGWKISSAGMIARPHSIDPEIIKYLKKLGVKDVNHKPIHVNRNLLKKYDLVIAFADDHIETLKKRYGYDDAILFNNLINKEGSIWDVEDEVPNYNKNGKGVEKYIDKTIQYINDSIPDLVYWIENSVYVFSDFLNGYKKENYGFPFVLLDQTRNTATFMGINIPEKEDSHILVIPKKRYVHIHDIPPKISKELMEAIQKAGKILFDYHQGYNIVVNTGKKAGQYIFHTHIHLIPRDVGDGIKISKWKDKNMTKEDFMRFNKGMRKRFK